MQLPVQVAAMSNPTFSLEVFALFKIKGHLPASWKQPIAKKMSSIENVKIEQHTRPMTSNLKIQIFHWLEF